MFKLRLNNKNVRQKCLRLWPMGIGIASLVYIALSLIVVICISGLKILVEHVGSKYSLRVDLIGNHLALIHDYSIPLTVVVYKGINM